jgi:hypothetical protein
MVDSGIVLKIKRKRMTNWRQNCKNVDKFIWVRAIAWFSEGIEECDRNASSGRSLVQPIPIDQSVFRISSKVMTRYCLPPDTAV